MMFHKAFGEHVIVQNGSFHIEDHEKAALVGINGAGKSTILKMIVGRAYSRWRDGCPYKRQDTWLSVHSIRRWNSGNTIYEEVRTAKADVIAMEASRSARLKKN